LLDDLGRIGGNRPGMRLSPRGRARASELCTSLVSCQALEGFA